MYDPAVLELSADPMLLNVKCDPAADITICVLSSVITKSSTASGAVPVCVVDVGAPLPSTAAILITRSCVPSTPFSPNTDPKIIILSATAYPVAVPPNTTVEYTLSV